MHPFAQLDIPDTGTWVAIITVGGSALVKVVSMILTSRAKNLGTNLTEKQRLDKSKDEWIKKLEASYDASVKRYDALQEKHDRTVERYEMEIDELQDELERLRMTADRMKQITEEHKEKP
jgi:predicted RNase H-like nuclease (RuvC/YqgF family)